MVNTRENQNTKEISKYIGWGGVLLAWRVAAGKEGLVGQELSSGDGEKHILFSLNWEREGNQKVGDGAASLTPFSKRSL